MKKGHGWPGLRLQLQQFRRWRPLFCCFCNQKTDTGLNICQYCLPHLPGITRKIGDLPRNSLCLRCGSEWLSDEVLQKCAECVNWASPISAIVSGFRYESPIDHLVTRLKYGHHLPAGRLLGELLAREVRQSLPHEQSPDVVVPVPLSQDRLRSRGFNQSAEIGKWSTNWLDLHFDPRLVGRRTETLSLAGLSRAERALQIRGAFWADSSVAGARIAIVDDVLTTGATAGELATELYDAGAEDVQLWTAARTPLGQHSTDKV